MDSGTQQSYIFNHNGPPFSTPNSEYFATRLPRIRLTPYVADQKNPDAMLRNVAQRANIQRKGVSASAPLFGPLLDWKYRTFYMDLLASPDESRSAESDDRPLSYGASPAPASEPEAEPTVVSRHNLLLFNVIVALEWLPDDAYLVQLEWAFRHASDLLYDATDGYMAFGQVVFASHEFMDCADIQIMASNRILPRSWVGGLKDPTKYQPIRMGRGIWHERNQVTIAWEEPEGYRTLIHEWAHYALTLLDQYVEPRGFKGGAKTQPDDLADVDVIVPKRRLTSISIMESLEGTSELVSHVSANKSKRDAAWDLIDGQYPGLRPADKLNDSMRLGPRWLPLPLPQFEYLDLRAPGSSPATAVPAQASMLVAQSIPDVPADPQNIAQRNDTGFLSRYWLYVLPRDDAGGYQRMIAQGTLDARSLEETFELLGVAGQSTLLLFAEPHDKAPQTFRAEVNALASGRLGRVAWAELDVDDRRIIDVIPLLPEQIGESVTVDPQQGANTAGPFYVSVRVQYAGQDPDLKAYLFPQGQTKSQRPFTLARIDDQDAINLGLDPANDWISKPVKLPSLDGHVLVEVNRTVLASTFSQGGGPPSHTGLPANPLTAGSSDGTAMLFFKPGNVDANKRPYGDRYKVVTNAVHGVQPKEPPGEDQRSSIYSIAANQPLPTDLGTTLVLYFDTPYQDKADFLRLYRLNDNRVGPQNKPWKELKPDVSSGGRFVTIPLMSAGLSDDGTGVQLVAAPGAPSDMRPRIDCFRLFGAPLPKDAA